MSGKAEYDVIVVGGGAPGCVVAARLSEDGIRRVLLLEAGPDYRMEIPVDVRNGWRPTTSHDRGYIAEPDEAGVARALPRGKLLGGCSSTNATFALRGHPADYDAWARLQPWKVVRGGAAVLRQAGKRRGLRRHAMAR